MFIVLNNTKLYHLCGCYWKKNLISPSEHILQFLSMFNGRSCTFDMKTKETIKCFVVDRN